MSTSSGNPSLICTVPFHTCCANVSSCCSQWAGEETFILAGGSYGGFVSLGYVLAHPTRVRALILRDTWASGFRGTLRVVQNIARSTEIKTDPEQLLRLWSGEVLDNHDFETGVNSILPIYTAKKGAPAAAPAPAEEGFEKAKPKYHYATHNAAFSYSVPRFDVRRRLQEIKAPTLIVIGRQDPIAPLANSEELHQGIKGSVLSIFDSSGHSPPSEEPEEFRKRVWGFLDSL